MSKRVRILEVLLHEMRGRESDQDGAVGRDLKTIDFTKEFIAVRRCTGMTGCSRSTSIAKRCVTSIASGVRSAATGVAVREERIGFGNDSFVQIRIREQLVD